MKFDVVVMNPPYQPPIKVFGKSNGNAKSIYDKFIKLALNRLIKDDGYLCAVHPSKWRRPNDDLWPIMKNKDIQYLEIHNKKDGKKMFDADTRYDWYILKNSIKTGRIEIIDDTSKKHSIDVSDWPYLPNSHFEEIENLLAKPNQKTCDLLYDYAAYPVNRERPWMSKTETDTYKYPCIHATGKKGTKFVYSSRRRELFDVPKVIFGDADRIYNAVLDWKGEYGLTPHAMAIRISSEEEGVLVKKALESDKFDEILQACKWSSFQIDYRLFKVFKEDFWKEFV